MLEFFDSIDRAVFLALNGLHNSTMDQVMVFISGKLEWIPLYALLLYFIIRKFKVQSWIIVLGAALTVALADQISVQLFKDVFERLRPCHNPEIADLVHQVNGKCGGKYGFVSSHAANSFAIATYLGMLLVWRSKKDTALLLLLLWAAVVSYSRVYLGVHYPMDIAAGGLLGIAIGFAVYRWVIYLIIKYQKV